MVLGSSPGKIFFKYLVTPKGIVLPFRQPVSMCPLSRYFLDIFIYYLFFLLLMGYKRRRSSGSYSASKRARTYTRTRRIPRRRFNRRRRRFARRGSRGTLGYFTKRNYGIGDSKLVRLVWSGEETVSVSASTYTNSTACTAIQVNSAYDPWNGITGTYNVTPGGFDLYSKLYNRYIVIGAKLVVTFRFNTTNASDQFNTWYKVGLHKATTSTLGYIDSWEKAASDPDSVTRNVVAIRQVPTRATVKMNFSVRKEYGVKDLRDQLLTTTGANAPVSGNPTFGMYVTPWWQPVGDGGIVNYAQKIYVEYHLYQSCLFYDRRDMGDLAAADSVIQGI